MALLDDLADGPVKKSMPCKVARVADTLAPDDREILLKAVMDPRWPVQKLENALRAKQILIGGNTLKLHRDENCSCSRT